MKSWIQTARELWNKFNEPGALKTATERQRADLTALQVGLASTAAVAAYVFQPVQRFASYEGLFLGGMFIAMAILPTFVFGSRDMAVVQLRLIQLLLFFSAALLFMVASNALDQSEWNDRRCLRIQEAMLRPKPSTRTDLADVFTALGCRPQGRAPRDRNYNPSKMNPPSAAETQAHENFLTNYLATEVRVDQGGNTLTNR